MNNSWDDVLKDEFEKEYFKELESRIDKEYLDETIYPPKDLIFNAFRHTPIEKIKIVIIGQDPYHEYGQAMGLSFSVPEGVKIPPSLVNIYKEMHDDLGTDIPKSGDLTLLADEGVFLLNSTLTVKEGLANSHQSYGWQTFTDNVIRIINDKRKNVVYILWGKNAASKEALIDSKNNLIIKSAHPSPLSAFNGFFGSKPFSKANRYLMLNEIEPVDFWVLR
jgi:uracil-DNA glycosylase